MNIVALPEKNSPAPAQDVLIFITPYLNVLPNAFRMTNLTAETLPIYVPYGFAVSKWSDYFAEPIMSFAWEIFMETNFTLNLLECECKIGAPRGYFGGYPQADFFFNDKPRSFDWKVTRPDAKKLFGRRIGRLIPQSNTQRFNGITSSCTNSPKRIRKFPGQSNRTRILCFRRWKREFSPMPTLSTIILTRGTICPTPKSSRAATIKRFSPLRTA